MCARTTAGHSLHRSLRGHPRQKLYLRLIDMLNFELVDRSTPVPSTGLSTVYLQIDHWNDFSYVTMFSVTIFDSTGKKTYLGSVKIGFMGQTKADSTYSVLERTFTNLEERFFSVGQDVDYYIRLYNELDKAVRDLYLIGIRDIVHDVSLLDRSQLEDVFRTSLLRYISISSIDGQFKRILDGGVPLTDFNFKFERPDSPEIAGIELAFPVKANSTPSTNIHAIIGRNGVGKTTLLNQMSLAVVDKDNTTSRFRCRDVLGGWDEIDESYFSSLISVSFSAFDPFLPPHENLDPGLGTRYSYVGLKDNEDESGTVLKSLTKLRKECCSSVSECLADQGRAERWLASMKTLESDENFAGMRLPRLANVSRDALSGQIEALVKRMSSGHAVVLLTISRLISRVEEKSLILIDEPESHLHPPLLSAFTRALGELLSNRNAVAIIATHSPVVLQEIPRACGHVITRSRLSMTAKRPRIETFGENVGSLTSEVFGLEVTQSGYHALLRDTVSSGGTYEQIMSMYKNQLGQEARGVLRALVAERDGGAQEL